MVKVRQRVGTDILLRMVTMVRSRKLRVFPGLMNLGLTYQPLLTQTDLIPKLPFPSTTLYVLRASLSFVLHLFLP